MRSCSLYSLHPPRQRVYSVVFIPLASQEMMGNPAQGRYRRSPARCQRGLGCSDLSVALTRSNLLQQTRAALHQGRGCHMTKASPWHRGKHGVRCPSLHASCPGPAFVDDVTRITSPGVSAKSVTEVGHSKCVLRSDAGYRAEPRARASKRTSNSHRKRAIPAVAARRCTPPPILLPDRPGPIPQSPQLHQGRKVSCRRQ